MFGSYFSPQHQGALLSAGVVVAVAVWQAWKGRTKTSVVLLTAAAFILRCIAATLDPFLNQWDECFHALVAKRMLDDPFTPWLFAPGVLPTTEAWTQAGLWLHKPPFFLWQMSASLAVFGLEPWAVRIPSALWLSALVPVTYRMGFLLAGERVGWIAALLATSSYYFMELTAGAVTTDHNDAVFIATVGCSWWALLEHWNDGRLRWALLAGLFAGCAILTKVFVGAVVFLPWSLAFLLWRDRNACRGWITGAGVAIGICVLWFGSLAVRFPEALAAQLAFDTGHLGQLVEGHAGGADFHFNVINALVPPFTWWLVVPAYAWLVYRTKRNTHRLFLGVLFVVIHLVFAWADTKMPSFTMVLFPLYLIALCSALVTATETLIVEHYRKGLLFVLVVVLAGYSLNLEVIQHRHTLASPPKPHQQWRQQQIEALPVLEKLAERIKGAPKVVVYHVPALHHIQFMFATGVEATDQRPQAADVARLRAQGYTVYALQDGEPVERFPGGVELISVREIRFPRVGRPE